jgi:hypothetical protein
MLGLSIGTALFQFFWGVSWAACICGLFFLSRRMRNRTKLGWMLIPGGILIGTVTVFLNLPYSELEHGPPQDHARGVLFAWGFGPIALASLVYWFVLRREFRAEDGLKKAAQARNEERRAHANLARKESFFAGIKGWPLRVPCLISGSPSLLMLDPAMKSLRTVSYVDDEFRVQADATIPLADIFSVEVQRTEVMEDYYRTELVPVVSSKKKSPVARSVVGWALLGPVGALVGAASGTRADIPTDVQERKVLDQRKRVGPAVLVLGTTNPLHPMIKISLESDHAVEEWKFRIKGAMTAA